MRLLTVLPSLVLAGWLPGALDVLPPGHKAVTHELVLEAAEPIAGAWRFIAAPTHGFGVTIVELGQPFRFSSKYGTRIWATRPSETPPERGRDPWFEGHPVTDVPVGEIASVPATHPLSRVVTTYRVTRVTESEVRLEFVREERYDAAGEPLDEDLPLAVLGTLAVVGMAGLVVVFRRRRARRPTP